MEPTGKGLHLVKNAEIRSKPPAIHLNKCFIIPWSRKSYSCPFKYRNQLILLFLYAYFLYTLGRCFGISFFIYTLCFTYQNKKKLTFSYIKLTWKFAQVLEVTNKNLTISHNPSNMQYYNFVRLQICKTENQTIKNQISQIPHVTNQKWMPIYQFACHLCYSLFPKLEEKKNKIKLNSYHDIHS